MTVLFIIQLIHVIFNNLYTHYLNKTWTSSLRNAWSDDKDSNMKQISKKITPPAVEVDDTRIGNLFFCL